MADDFISPYFFDECIRTRREGPSKVNHELGGKCYNQGGVLNNPLFVLFCVIDLPCNLVTQANALPFIRPFNWAEQVLLRVQENEANY